MIRTYAVAPGTAPDPELVTAYLVGRGYRIGPGGVACGVDWIAADLDRDAAADLAAYRPPDEPSRRAMEYLAGRLATIRAKAPASRTASELDLLALATLLRGDL